MARKPAGKAAAGRKAPARGKAVEARPPGRPPHQPTAQSRAQVQAFAAYGVPQAQIALLLGVALDTLRKHYLPQLDLGSAQATAKVAQTLYQRATSGNDLGATIFWLKARAGWSERAPDQRVKHEGTVEHAHSGEVVFTAEQRAAVLAAVRARAVADEAADAGAGAARAD